MSDKKVQGMNLNNDEPDRKSDVTSPKGFNRFINRKTVLYSTAGMMLLGSGFLATNADARGAVQTSANEVSVRVMKSRNSSDFVNKDTLTKDEDVKIATSKAMDTIDSSWTDNKAGQIRAEIDRQREIGLSVYVIQWGDTIDMISEVTGEPVDKLVSTNNLSDGSRLVTGDLLDGVLYEAITEKDVVETDVEDVVTSKSNPKVDNKDLKFDEDSKDTSASVIDESSDEDTEEKEDVKKPSEDVNYKGDAIDEDGNLVDDGGNLIDEDGNLIDSEGRAIDEDGNLIDGDGHLINEDGHLINEDGDLVDHNGDVIDEDGRLVIEKDEDDEESEDESKDEKIPDKVKIEKPEKDADDVSPEKDKDALGEVPVADEDLEDVEEVVEGADPDAEEDKDFKPDLYIVLEQDGHSFEDAPFESETIEDDTLDVGTEIVEVTGALGIERHDWSETEYSDGSIEKTDRVKSVIQEPISNVVRVGTKEVVKEEEKTYDELRFVTTDFKTIRKEVDNLAPGEEELIQMGQDGVVYQLVRVTEDSNGKISNEEMLNDNFEGFYEPDDADVFPMNSVDEIIHVGKEDSKSTMLSYIDIKDDKYEMTVKEYTDDIKFEVFEEKIPVGVDFDTDEGPTINVQDGQQYIASEGSNGKLIRTVEVYTLDGVVVYELERFAEVSDEFENRIIYTGDKSL